MTVRIVTDSLSDLTSDLIGNLDITLVPLTVLFGHVMNITLSLLAVLVHGVRLNTLEFSNHAGLKWAGFQFKPFKKLENDYILKGE